MEEGDMLIYADAGCRVNKEGEERFYQYLDMIRQSPYNMISMTTAHEYRYTTEHIFRAFNIDPLDELVRSSGQYIATALIMEKGDHLRQWLAMVKLAKT